MCNIQWLAFLLLFSANVTAADKDAMQHLVEDKGCIACHGLQETRLAPPFQAIAIRYQNSDEQTVETLATKILKGGAGNWGVVPMIANTNVTPEQAHDMVRWILQLKP